MRFLSARVSPGMPVMPFCWQFELLEAKMKLDETVRRHGLRCP
jgi:hypothetical protein